MNTYPFMYMGLCVNNNDPEQRGRVQVFIPHIMPALYDGWNKEGLDIDITCVGPNLQNGLTNEQIIKLRQILPWAESASPICGGSAPGDLLEQTKSAVKGAISAVGSAISSGLEYVQSPAAIPASSSEFTSLAEQSGSVHQKSDAGLIPVTPDNPSSGGPDPSIANITKPISNTTPLGISPSDVQPIGDARPHTVSTYGSVFADLTTYFDVAPNQRPAEATAYWQNKGINLAAQESSLQSRGIKTGTLSMQDTTQGKYVGNLIPGFDIAVPSNNAYGLKGGSMVYIADKSGSPLGTNGGYFRVADTGSSAALTGQSNSGGIDFYAGNDSSLTNYFNNLNTNGTNIVVQPINITGDSANALVDFVSTNGSDTAISSAIPTTSTGAQSTSIVNKTMPYGPMATQNLNNTAKGLFTYPSAGAMLWVFFREGNPLYPVYFAASYSNDEWKSAYRYQSPSDGYAPGGVNGVTSTGTNLYLQGGGISTHNNVCPEDPTKNQQSFMMFGPQGSNITFHDDHDQFLSKFSRRDQVEGDRWNTTLGYKEDWVQGDHNHVTMGDSIIKVGNCSKEAVDAVNKIIEKIKESQKPLSELKK